MRGGLNIRGACPPAHGRRPCWERVREGVAKKIAVIATKQNETNQQTATVFFGQ